MFIIKKLAKLGSWECSVVTRLRSAFHDLRESTLKVLGGSGDMEY